MRTTVRQVTVAILLTVLLAPGLLQARTPARHLAQASSSTSISATELLSSVWNLLIGSMLKNGGQLDPSGGSTGSTTTATPPAAPGDNGGQLDPSGTPK
jgi:hypothetical protein